MMVIEISKFWYYNFYSYFFYIKIKEFVGVIAVPHLIKLDSSMAWDYLYNNEICYYSNP